MCHSSYYFLSFSALIGVFVVSFTNTTSGSSFNSNVEILGINTPHRASQGVALNDSHLFVTTSLNEEGRPENIISIYSLEGKLLKEKRNASFQLDPYGKIMDFGDAAVIGNRLYVTLYNWNSVHGTQLPLYSSIAVFDTGNLSQIRLHRIGGDAVESIAYHGGHFWTSFHDKPIIKEFDGNFKPINTYTLRLPPNVKIRDGYIEGMIWLDNDILVNIHGPNIECSFYSPGLIKYHFNGSQFKYVETLTPPTYGSGQGLDINRDTFYFVDRPWNAIISVHGPLKSMQNFSKLSPQNVSNSISVNSSMNVKVNNETIKSVTASLKSFISNILGSRDTEPSTEKCNHVIIKTKVFNQINNESQYVEGYEETDLITDLEISKALKSAVSSTELPWANVTTEITSMCNRDDFKGISCENFIVLKLGPTYE